MAQAADQHTPREWDEDRWTLNDAFDYLTKALGYSEERALYEMEQARLARRLAVRVQKIVDGKPQGDPVYLPFDKKHKLVRHLGWVVPQNHKWGDNRWTVYRQIVLDLWPSRPPAFPSAPDQQPEDWASLDPLKTGDADHSSAEQSPQEPLTSKKWLTVEIERRKKLGDIPEEITEFSRQLHSQMKDSLRAGVVDRAIVPRTIETHLRTWKIFPKKKRSQKS
jgi:hypothetical protein